MAMFPWVAWLLSTATAVPFLPKEKGTTDSFEFPWTLPAKPYKDLADSVVSKLVECSIYFHGCLRRLVGYDIPGAFLTLCSCEANCIAYGNCCLNAELPEREEGHAPLSSCVQVEHRGGNTLTINMVVECPRTWSDEDVRKGCEEPENFDEVFYRIPVTGSDYIIYRNGFCALCNNDATNAIFWSTAKFEEGQDAMVNIPDEIFNLPAMHFTSCVGGPFIETCTQPGPEDLSLKCKMYYAPVQAVGAVKFKNVYCAKCNGANMSALSCSPVHYQEILPYAMYRDSSNFTSTFKQVERTPACLAQYDGRCYIKHDADGNEPSPRIALNHTLANLPSNKTDNDELSVINEAKHYLTLVCISLSIVCLLLKILVLCVYKKSRSFSSKCTLCLAFTLVITHAIFLISHCAHLPPTGCVASGVLVHYGFLSTFCWTCALSYDICRSLTTAKLSSTRNTKLAMCGIFAWGVPALITGSALTVDRTAPGTALSPSYGNPICWIGMFWSLILYFLVPVAVLFSLCMFFYLKSVSYIRRTSSAAGSARREGETNGVEEVRSTKQRNHAVLFVRLAMIMCSPWAMAFVETFMTFKAVGCLVNFLVGLQGVYLFFAFKDYRYFLSSMRKRGISVYAIKSCVTTKERLSLCKKP